MRALVIATLLALVTTACPTSPQRILIKIGRTKTVANGQAELRFVTPGEGYRSADPYDRNVQVELQCDGHTYSRVVFAERLSQPACGVQLKLLQVLDDSSVVARLEVHWQ